MKDKRGALRALVMMAAVDGRIGQREQRLLARACRLWELPPACLEESIAQVESGDTQIPIPADRGGRRELLLALIAVAAVDGVIDPDEESLLVAIASRFGTSTSDLKALVKKALDRRASRRQQQVAASPSRGFDSCSEAQEFGTATPTEPWSVARLTFAASAILTLGFLASGGLGIWAGSRARKEMKKTAASYKAETDGVLWGRRKKLDADLEARRRARAAEGEVSREQAAKVAGEEARTKRARVELERLASREVKARIRRREAEFVRTFEAR